VTTLSFLSHQPLVHALGWSLLHFWWQGAVIAILLASVLGLLRGGSPQLRYTIACAGLALMVIAPLATFARLAVSAQAGEARLAGSDIEHSALPILLDSPGANPEPWIERIANQLDRSLPWVLSTWGAGVMLLLVRLNLGLLAARRMQSAASQPAPDDLHLMLERLCRRLGIERTIRLANSALVQAPTVVGWLRPVILIPVGCLMGLSASQVEAVLAHELAHIRRHDYLVSVLQSVVETLLFYHPAVWWVSQQVRREREHCCDDLAVQISGDSLAYAKALSFLEERRAAVPMMALGANGGVLIMRIRRLLGIKESPAVSKLAASTLLAVVFVATGLCVGTAARAASQQGAVSGISSQGSLTKYQKWLDEDVVWIIDRRERSAFLRLKADEEKDKFMEDFWERRNPTPGSAENPAKKEHYRRIEYANAYFTEAITPGWKTDRGRIYIVYGPPDQIDSFPRPGGQFSPKPNDHWIYKSIDEHGVTRKNVGMTFVDECSCGKYKLRSGAD
jgi:GWxTD domain-containing protein